MSAIDQIARWFVRAEQWHLGLARRFADAPGIVVRSPVIDSLMVRAEDGATVEVVERADGSRVLIVKRARVDCPGVVDCVEVRLDVDRSAFLATALQRGGRA